MKTVHESLTVVIPAFNAEKTILSSIMSAQRVGASRVIVVDDGSTDNTRDLVATTDVLLISQNNMGASNARYKGLELVETEYVVFLDADDYLVYDGVARSIEILNKNIHYCVVAGKVQQIYKERVIRTTSTAVVPLTTVGLLRVGFSAWPPGAAVIRKKAILEAAALDIGFLNTRFAEDYEMFIRLSVIGRFFQHERVSLVYQLQGGKSTTNTELAIESKEAIRRFYSQALGVPLNETSSARIRLSSAMKQLRSVKLGGGVLSKMLAYKNVGTALVATMANKLFHPKKTHENVDVHLWLTGQDENIGDSLLRRPLLDLARSYGLVSIYTGKASRNFLSGLCLHGHELLNKSFIKWLLIVLSSRGGIVFVNAGEMKVSGKGSLKILLLVSASTLTRKKIVWLGASCFGGRASFLPVYRWLATKSTALYFRDQETAELLGNGRTMPDWAFSIDSPNNVDKNRRYLSLVIRSDRPRPSAEWVAWVKDSALKLDLKIVLVVQVLRDNTLYEWFEENFDDGVVVPFEAQLLTWHKKL